MPGAGGDGEQPVLLGQALPLALHRHGDEVPPVIFELVRVPVQGQAVKGALARNRKGGSSRSDDRGALPQVEGMNLSPVW